MSIDTPRLSVVVPFYNCLSSIEELTKLVFGLEQILGELELLLVDDASPSDPRTRVAELRINFPRLRLVRLPRNRGQHYASFFGVKEATGSRVVIMDCDLENSPSDIPILLAKLNQFDCVVGRSKDRGKHNFVRRAIRHIYGRVLGYATGISVQKLGLNSFSFCALNERATSYLRARQLTTVPISTLLLRSNLFVGTCEVSTKSQESRSSSYSIFENVDVALRSLLFAGKQFRVLLLKLLAVQIIVITLLVLAIIVQLITKGSSDGWFSFLLVSALLSFLATCTLIAVLVVGSIQAEYTGD